VPSVDVIVPTTRPSIIDLVMSLSLGTLVPDNIWAVGNEQRPHWPSVATVTFDSDTQPIGRGDAGLRRNIGADISDADILVFLDDDLIAPRQMLEKTVEIVGRDGFCWGHHRFLDFTPLREQNDLSALLDKPPGEGRSREAYVNDWHGWQSSYAGLLGIRRDLFWKVGGFDLGFLGFHGSEDQHLGRRLSKGSNRTFVHEPPFAWHPEEDLYHSEPVTNVEGSHQLRTVTVNGQVFAICETCPYRRPSDPGALVLSDQVAIPYSRSDFRIEKEWT
jgi:hypothetical protein